MTRISSTIKPEELCDQMLIAEHREIVRIPNCIKSGKAKVEGIPEDFRLGSGHVKFFYNKIAYLYMRYNRLRQECLKRGFNVQDYSDAFKDIPQHLWNVWIPNIPKVRPLLVERINDRLCGMKVIRYNGVVVDYESLKLK